jgi:hypothetical protein
MPIVDLLQRDRSAWSLNELVREADELLTAALDTASEIEADLVETPWPIVTDRLKVTAIIIALCARATPCRAAARCASRRATSR